VSWTIAVLLDDCSPAGLFHVLLDYFMSYWTIAVLLDYFMSYWTIAVLLDDCSPAGRLQSCWTIAVLLDDCSPAGLFHVLSQKGSFLGRFSGIVQVSVPIGLVCPVCCPEMFSIISFGSCKIKDLQGAK
jgi:hypothetical protein